jgi:hypothetical protein
VTASRASAARSASRHGTTTERTTDRAGCPPVGIVGGPDRGPGSDVAANVSTIPFVAAAIAVSARALVIPPFAVIIANVASATDRRRP